MDTSGDMCRRSSRKKIIKFDVRDLLNKHRKPHKIQIEARIDSNAPIVSTRTIDAESIIEKTSIIQRTVAFDHSQHGPTQVPIPLKTEIFKPNQGSSLIVAQMESTSTAPKALTMVETEVVVPKRRGRPPKKREEGKTETIKQTLLPHEQSQEPGNDVSEKICEDKNDDAIEIEKSNDTSFIEIIEDFDLEELAKMEKVDGKVESNTEIENEEAYDYTFSDDAIKIMTENIQEAGRAVILPPKKQFKKYRQEIQNEINDDNPEAESIQANESISIEVHAKKDFEDDAETSRTALTPTPQRCERRSGRRLGDNLNQTLEETFAEIAAKSSKAILDMASPKLDEDSLKEFDALTIDNVLTQTVSQESPVQQDSKSRSTSPKEQPTDHEAVLVKKRGRKPKPKPIIDSDDSIKIEAEATQGMHVQIDQSQKLDIFTTEQKTNEEDKFPPIVYLENENLETQNLVEKTFEVPATQDEVNLILATTTSNTAPIKKPTIKSNTTYPEGLEKGEENNRESKDRYEEISSSKKSSSHHKHHKTEQYPQRSSSSEKKKKDRTNEHEFTKLKLPSKDKLNEDGNKKRSKTSESGKKKRIPSEDVSSKKFSSMPIEKLTTDCSKKSITSCNEKTEDGSNSKAAPIDKDMSLSEDKGKSSLSIREKPDNENTKKTISLSKERTAVDVLKESTLLSPDRAPIESDPKNTSASKGKISIAAVSSRETFGIENLKKAPVSKEKSIIDSQKKWILLSPEKSAKFIKEKHLIDDVGKSSLNKEKPNNEGFKKSKLLMESHPKKQSLPIKEKSNDVGHKKLLSTSDERCKKSNSDDNLKKVLWTSESKTTIDGKPKTEKVFNELLSGFNPEKKKSDKKKIFGESLMFGSTLEKRKTYKKKHKPKSDEVVPSSLKYKINTSSNVTSTTPSSISKESLLKSSNSHDNKSHKRERKHKDLLDGSLSKSTSKSQEKSIEKGQKSLSKELKEVKKQAHKERQKKFKEAFEAVLKENNEEKKVQQLECVPTESAPPTINTTSNIEESQSVMPEIILPPTPGESDAGGELNDQLTKSCLNNDDEIVGPSEVKSTTVVESDPLYDIEKFIEAGVNLLKRDYKLEEDQEEVKPKETQNADAVSKCAVKTIGEVEPTSKLHAMDDGAKGKNDHTNLDIKPNPSTQEVFDFYETPANTPASTPARMTPSSSPTPTDNSVDTYYYSDGVRRSHRLKKIINAPKALVGRGLVRDRDRERLALRDDVETKSYYSIEDHLMDLAEVEAKNAKFLKEMEERLSNFEVIKENEYHCERIASREARKMVCDCFLTPEEAERGELGCGEDCLNRLLMIECSVHCKVGERCTNKRFQKYLCAPCRVFRTEKKGFGIMADVEIHPGEFIMEYVGEVLDSEEFEDRRVAYSKEKNRHYYFMALRSDSIIDATIKGNVSRFINHSCDPNAETQKWTVNGELRIGFFSRKTIMPGEEITFDYQYQRYGREAQRCYCESANCRGWIGEEPASDEEEQIDDEDDEDDDDEYDEDENDVVSMVKGLMSVEDGDDDDGKDEMSEVTRQTIQDAAVKAQLRKKQSMESTETGSMREPSLDGETDESKIKFMAYLSKISAKIELHKKSVREEKKRKRQQRKKAATERRPPTTSNARFLEDPDLEDEIDFLSRCGLKNQSDTLRLSRLMVRAKLAATRLNLLAILREGELPCRRLFLDYHGLHLLHGWVNDDGRTDMTLRMAILETLESLPIPNKTILTESKVYQAIRSWCTSETLQPSRKSEGSSSPSDDSSKESITGSSTEKKSSNAETEKTTEESESPKSELEKLAIRLLTSWDNLPEIFRIPKRERIEQMKEHEREADRQYAATVEADTEDDRKELSTDRYQRDRFERRFGKPQGSRTITVLGGGGMGISSKRLISSDVISPEDTKHLSKEQRRELFAAKVARDEAEKRQAERRREFETKCTFFGLDPLLARPEDIPFCVSDSGQWYNERRQIIQTPPAFAHVPTPTKPKSTNPSDYYLPSAATNLPPEWAYAINDQGKIYYYHLKHRIPQWEPPTTEQINQTKWSDDESESDDDDNENTKELSEERIKEIEAIETQEELNLLIKKIVQEQRQARYKRLVDERPISPRREEDRIYNQIEMRKYKENKEKIKKRKEEIRRRRSETIKNSMLNLCTFGSLDDKPSTSTAAVGLLTENTKTYTEPSDVPTDALPIQDYLLSSDEDNEDIDEMKAECNNSPLLDKIVQGDKIVDELDALTTKRQLKRPLPPHREFNFDLNTSNNMSTEILLSSLEKIEHKKRKQEKKEKSKRSRESNDAKYRKLKEKFRCEIAGIIVQHLKPYRKDSCVFGRIKSNEDFNHLAKKLTHFVMIKELKYCESVGQTLVVTESVKNKSREFIRKYMAKYEAGYVKPDNDPEFKEIPYTL